MDPNLLLSSRSLPDCRYTETAISKESNKFNYFSRSGNKGKLSEVHIDHRIRACESPILT